MQQPPENQETGVSIDDMRKTMEGAVYPNAQAALDAVRTLKLGIVTSITAEGNIARCAPGSSMETEHCILIREQDGSFRFTEFGISQVLVQLLMKSFDTDEMWQ